MLELMPPFYFLTFAKVSVSVSKTFGLKKSLGIGLKNFGLKKVSVSVLNILVSKKSQYRSRKFWSQKSLGIGLKKSSSYADIIFQRDTSNTFNDFVS